MAEKMYLTPYTYGPLPRPEFSRDGLQMNCDESALFLGNKMLPKDTVTLIELTVNSYTPLPNIRHLPIYVGFHEEPSLGLLNASCCFGSLYYKEGADYDCFEHVAGGTTHTRFVPSKVYTRIPAATEVIGVKYDPMNNEVSIYRDGNLFYRFSPRFNNLAIGDFYPAVFVMNNCNLNARINFGKKGLQFPQSDAMSLFGYYFKKKPLTSEILFDLIAEPKPNRFMVDDEILIDVKVDSDILPGAMVPLYMESPQAIFTDSTNLKFDINKPSTTNYDYFGATLTSNRGLPYDEKVYVEFQVKNGILLNGTVGIPISVGISNTKGYIMNNSLRLNMFHLQQQTYQYREVKRSVTTLLYATSGIMTTVSPNQAMWVGVAFDLKNKEYTVYINSIPFYTVKVPSLVFTPGSGETYYFMLHQEGIEKNDDPMNGNGGLPLKGEVNFGQTPLHTVLPSGYMTLWDYYNNYYHIPILPYREICFDFMAYPYKMKLEAEILWHFRAIGQELFGQEASMNPGLNQFKGTMNRVMDEEEHFIPDQGIELLDLLMRFDNFNYTTEKLFEKEDFFRGQDIYIGNWENRVLRYIDFDFGSENKRKIPNKDIDFNIYSQNKLPNITINIDIISVVKLIHNLSFEIEILDLDFLEVFIFNFSIVYNNVTDTTDVSFVYGIKQGVYTTDPINFFLLNGTVVYIPSTNPVVTTTISIREEPTVLTLVTLAKSYTINGIFKDSDYNDIIPELYKVGPSKDSITTYVNGVNSTPKIIDHLISTGSFVKDQYTCSGDIDINLASGTLVTDIDMKIGGITRFPVRYTNLLGDLKEIKYENIDGTNIIFNNSTNELILKQSFTTEVSREYYPSSGFSNYSDIFSNSISINENITYTGNMNRDFNSSPNTINASFLTIYSGPVRKYEVEIYVEISNIKWQVINHYISTNDLNEVRCTFVTSSSIFGTFTIKVPKADIDTTKLKLEIATTSYDLNSNWIFNNMNDADNEAKIIAASSLTITLV